MRGRTPLPLWILAGIGIVFVSLPLVALLIRAPWGDIGSAFTGAGAGTALRLSIVVSLAATALSVVLGVPLAWILARSILVGRSVLRAIVVLPIVLPPVVGGIGLLAALGRGGVVGRWLYEAAGIQLTFTTGGAIVATTFVSMPLVVLATEAGLRSIDRRYESAAAALGASPRYAIRRVVLPMLGPQLAAGAVLAWARALGEFGATITFAGNLAGRTQTLPLARLRGAADRPRWGDLPVADLGRAVDRGARRDARSHHAGALSAMGLHADIVARRGAFEVAVTLDVDDGETLALLGPNGAGKSTVVDALTGTLELAAGTIELDGERIDHQPPERRSIGVCFQDDLLFPRLSALENVAFPLRARKVARATAREQAATLLTRLAPGVDAAASPTALSGGERQRVALARALAPEPRLLLLDEPFANVDVSARAGLRALVRDVARGFGGATVLIAHEPLDALTLADRVTLLEGGLMTQTGTPGRDPREARLGLRRRPRRREPVRRQPPPAPRRSGDLEDRPRRHHGLPRASRGRRHASDRHLEAHRRLAARR